MVNVESLLSPTGGRDYDQVVGTTGVGLALSVALDPGLFERFIAKPLIKDYYRESRAEYIRKTKGLGPLAQPGGIEGAINRARQRGVPRMLQTGTGPTAGVFENPNYSKERQRLAQELKQLRNAKKRLRASRKAGSAKLKKQLRVDKSFMRAASWTMLLAFVGDMAMQAFTPGITKVAAQRDEQALGFSNPSDSPGSYTMRQRAVMAIHDSMMSVRNVMGNEAQFMHR